MLWYRHVIPCFRSFILLPLRSHRFHIFHRGCLWRANPCIDGDWHYTTTCTPSSRNESPLYSRWLWWTLDSSIYKTSIPEGCDTRTMFRMQELVIVYIYNIIRSNLDTKRLINGLFYPMLDRHLIADHLGWFKESTQDSSGWQVAYYWGIVESERGEGPKG